MDEQKVMAEFGKVYSALKTADNNVAIMRDAITKIGDGINNHIDICNENFEFMSGVVHKLNKYAKRQNIIIIAGIGGFLYLCKKIQKLEDATKKE